MNHSLKTLASEIKATNYPPLLGLVAVRAVAHHGSLTAAAEILGLTHGALSRRVASVEAWLGASLFERHGRGMQLTPDGQRFLSRIEDAFALIEAASDSWRGQRGTHVVRISVVPSFARYWLLPRLQDLEQYNDGGPKLRVEVAVEHRNADLEHGEVDIAIRYGRGRWRGVEAQPLIEEALTPVAQQALAKTLGSSADPKTLLTQPLLHDSDATGWRTWLQAAGIEKFKVRPHDRRFEDYGLVLTAAQTGLGIALARVPFATAAVKSAGLMYLSKRRVTSPLSYHVVTRIRETRLGVLTLVSRLQALAGNSR